MCDKYSEKCEESKFRKVEWLKENIPIGIHHEQKYESKTVHDVINEYWVNQGG
jgi:hypothetical protein